MSNIFVDVVCWRGGLALLGRLRMCYSRSFVRYNAIVVAMDAQTQPSDDIEEAEGIGQK